MDIKIAELMLRYIAKVVNKHRARGLALKRYSKISGEVSYRLEWCDCG
jgi:hypothetical protein